jgi:hypothetical protein
MPPVTLFVRSFKDGVGRQAPSKRLPTEAQDLINTVVTVERSAEKRPGTIATTCTELDGTTITTYGDLELPASADDMFHYWFDLTPSAVYLISVDYKGAGDLIYIHEVVHNGGTPTIRKITSIAGSTSIRDYARQGNGTYEAKEALEMISLGPTLLLLNKAAATGYTSDADGFEFDINGAVTAVPDPIGAPRPRPHWRPRLVHLSFRYGSRGYCPYLGGEPSVCGRPGSLPSFGWRRRYYLPS